LVTQVLAHESVLQFAPQRTWATLQLLVDEKQGCENITLKLLGLVPALAAVARHEAQVNKTMPMCSSTTRDLSAWILQRAMTVFKSLSAHSLEPVMPPEQQSAADAWRTVCRLAVRQTSLT
jgi:hypothetical protein